MPLFVICLLVFAVGIALVLAARLLRSYPLAFGGLVVVAAASGLAFADGNTLLGIFWLVFSAAAAVSAGLYYYKNIRGAFWWSLGATVALVLAAVPWDEFVEEADSAELLGYLCAPIAFVVIGLIGSLLVPRLIHKDKDQRKHRTNSDLIIGKRITITPRQDRILFNERLFK